MLSRQKLSGDPPETLRGGSPDFLAKSLANPDKIFKKNAKKNFFWKFCLDLPVILARISGDPPQRVSGGSPDNFRRDNIAGPHGISDFMQYTRFTF